MPLIIAPTVVLYIHTFNWVNKIYKNSENTMTWGEFIEILSRSIAPPDRGSHQSRTHQQAP